MIYKHIYWPSSDSERVHILSHSYIAQWIKLKTHTHVAFQE